MSTTPIPGTTTGPNVVIVMSPVAHFSCKFCIFYSKIMTYFSIDNKIWIVWESDNPGKQLFCNTDSLVVGK